MTEPLTAREKPDQCEYPDPCVPGDTCINHARRRRKTPNGWLWLCDAHFDRPITELFDEDGSETAEPLTAREEIARAMQGVLPGAAWTHCCELSDTALAVITRRIRAKVAQYRQAELYDEAWSLVCMAEELER